MIASICRLVTIIRNYRHKKNVVYELKHGWNPSFCAEAQFWTDFEITKCWCDLEIMSRSPNLINSFPLSTKYLCKFGQNPPTRSEVTSVGKAEFYSLSRMVTLKITSRWPNSNQIFIVSQWYIIWSLARSHNSIQDITSGKLFQSNLIFQSAGMTLFSRSRLHLCKFG